MTRHNGADTILWKSGTWIEGTWEGGVWVTGEWRSGTWLSGTWHGGTWETGEWHNGQWLNGTWRGGTWLYGEWVSGEWLNGNWEHGVWRSGTWHSGQFASGTWHHGTWHNGWFFADWHDGQWLSGNFCGETWRSGDWVSGVWYGGNWLSGTWFSGAIAQANGYTRSTTPPINGAGQAHTVYAVAVGGLLKIGITRKDIEQQRFGAIQRDSGHPVRIIHTWTVSSRQEALALERRLHAHLGRGTSNSQYWIRSIAEPWGGHTECFKPEALFALSELGPLEELPQVLQR